MKKSIYWLVVMALIGLLAVNGVAFAQPPPGPKVTYNVRMPSSGIATEFELVHLIQDFAPGSSTPVHTHGGQGLALVIDGELTQRMEGQPDKVYKAGETFIETPGVYFAVAKPATRPLASL
jgi:quercetin dioxygenase-like cupin family protein